MDIYKAQLLDHYRAPRNRGLLPAPDFASQACNPSCGDSVSIQGCVGGDGTGDGVEDRVIVTVLAFQGSGCVISQATASLLTEYAMGKSFDEILGITTERILELVGMQLGPTRLKCALLPLDALKQALEQYDPSINSGRTEWEGDDE